MKKVYLDLPGGWRAATREIYLRGPPDDPDADYAELLHIRAGTLYSPIGLLERLASIAERVGVDRSTSRPSALESSVVAGCNALEPQVREKLVHRDASLVDWIRASYPIINERQREEDVRTVALQVGRLPREELSVWEARGPDALDSYVGRVGFLPELIEQGLGYRCLATYKGSEEGSLMLPVRMLAGRTVRADEFAQMTAEDRSGTHHLMGQIGGCLASEGAAALLYDGSEEVLAAHLLNLTETLAGFGVLGTSITGQIEMRSSASNN